MPDGGRIIAITYAPGGRTGTWAPWVAMGSAKAALESLCRYFALATRRIAVNAVSPSVTDDSVFNTLRPRCCRCSGNGPRAAGYRCGKCALSPRNRCADLRLS
jgi:NAD(P)-dependent dehydrogenase (short-subunit alcohol dehydrogenase family)